ncbi:Hypothetical predicted protein [Pelobates cultripes]|uniref:Uncharacterized protein n=1 Tax=Pelobates cultripes TaxID=61616 RepID=A0AAD1TFN8_PELCU|nr:Hypothetical predicted protein [Pelobates cultripes]
MDSCPPEEPGGQPQEIDTSTHETTERLSTYGPNLGAVDPILEIKEVTGPDSPVEDNDCEKQSLFDKLDNEHSDHDPAEVHSVCEGQPVFYNLTDGGNVCSNKPFDPPLEAAACCDGTEPSSDINGPKTFITEQLEKLCSPDVMGRSVPELDTEKQCEVVCTKNELSGTHVSPPNESLLDELETELSSTEIDCKLPNGLNKGEWTLNMLEKCVQDKYLLQEDTIRRLMEENQKHQQMIVDICSEKDNLREDLKNRAEMETKHRDTIKQLTMEKIEPKNGPPPARLWKGVKTEKHEILLRQASAPSTLSCTSGAKLQPIIILIWLLFNPQPTEQRMGEREEEFIEVPGENAGMSPTPERRPPHPKTHLAFIELDVTNRRLPGVEAPPPTPDNLITQQARRLVKDSCCRWETETSRQSREIEKLKEEVNSYAIKVKWAHNKLKTELDTHKPGSSDIALRLSLHSRGALI